MDWLPRWKQDDLTPWEQRPFSIGVEAGPRPEDNRDNHERVVGHEAPGPPLPDGIARRLADAILRFDVFPKSMLTGVLRRQPIEAGDTIALRYRFMPGLDVFFAARVFDRFEETTATQWRASRITPARSSGVRRGDVCRREDRRPRAPSLCAVVAAGVVDYEVTYPIMPRLQRAAAR